MGVFAVLKRAFTGKEISDAEVETFLQRPRMLPSTCFLLCLLLVKTLLLWGLHTAFQVNNLHLVTKAPPWELGENLTLEFSEDMRVSVWNESSGKQVEYVRIGVSRGYMALWEEALPEPLESSWMWLAEAVFDILAVVADVEPDAFFVDAFSHAFELIPGTKVVIVPPVEASLLAIPWGMFLNTDQNHFPQGTVVQAQSTNGTLLDYSYLVRMDGESEEVVVAEAGRLKPLERWLHVMTQDRFQKWAKEIADNDTLLAEAVGDSVAVMGESQFAILDGYSFTKKSYEFLDYWKFPIFRPKLRRNLTAFALRAYKPLHLLFEYGCVSASNVDHMAHGVFGEEDTCSAQLMICTNQTITNGFAQVQDEAVGEFRAALALYLVGMYVAVPFAVVLCNLLPLTYVGVNLLRHVETELTTLRTCAKVTCECVAPILILRGLVEVVYTVVNVKNPFLFMIPSIHDYMKESNMLFYGPAILSCYCIVVLRGAQAAREYKTTLELRKSVRRKQKLQEDEVNPTCRICFGGADDGKLISPCLCSGSIRFVHLDCLNHWRRASANRKSAFQCNQCGFKYSMRRTRVASILRASLVLNLVALCVFIFILLCSSYVVAFLRSFHPELGIDFFNGSSLEEDDESDQEVIGVYELESLFTIPLQGLGLRFVDLCGGVFILGFIGIFFSGFSLDGLFLLALGRRRGRAEPDIAMVYLLLLGLVKFHFALYNFFKDYSAKLLQSAEENILEVGESYTATATRLQAEQGEDDDILFNESDHERSDTGDLAFPGKDSADEKAEKNTDPMKEAAPTNLDERNDYTQG